LGHEGFVFTERPLRDQNGLCEIAGINNDELRVRGHHDGANEREDKDYAFHLTSLATLRE
jgi:hypothetical protein